MKLAGRTILITGGGSGIGLALAKKFVELGNKVIITGRSQDRLTKAAGEVPGIETYPCDVADAEQITALAAKVSAAHPSLDVLVNNAGIMVFQDLGKGDSDLGHLTREIRTNLIGPIQMVSAFVDLLVKNKGH